MSDTSSITVAESVVTIELLNNIKVDVDAVIVHTSTTAGEKTIVQLAITSLIDYYRIRNIVSKMELNTEEWNDSDTQTKNLLLTDYQYIFSFIF